MLCHPEARFMWLPTWSPFALAEPYLGIKGRFGSVFLVSYTTQAEAIVFPEHRVQDSAFWCEASWPEGGREGWGRGATGSSPSQRLFQWNHRERFVTVGPALAQSPHTMPASIYLYPAEREVFVWDALNSHMQNGCLFVPIIHARSLNLNSPLPSAAPVSSRLFSAWNINEFLMIPNGTPPPHSPPLAPQRLSVNYCGVNCARRAARFCKPTANAIKVCSEPLGEHKYLVNSFVLHLDWSHSSKEKPSDWQTSERRSRFY